MIHYMMLPTIRWVLVGIALLAWPTLVRAHSELIAAEPRPGAQLAAAPAEIRLTFSTQLLPGSTFVLWSENFRQVSGVVPQFDPQQPKQLFAALPPLAAGDYTVQWTTVGDDGHTFSGSYAFRILPTAEGKGEDDWIRGWPAAVGAVALVLLIRIARRNNRFRWLHESFWR